MRSLLILFYYAIAVLLGFYLRGRYDELMYKTPHCQRRLRLWARWVCSPAAGPDPVLPPSTIESHAFQPDSAVDPTVVPSVGSLPEPPVSSSSPDSTGPEPPAAGPPPIMPR